MRSQPGYPSELEALVRRHGATFDPHYPPSDNSDHGPMAYLAMHGLGIGFDDIEAFAATYRSQTRFDTAPDRIRQRGDLAQTTSGRRESYAALVAFFVREIESIGWQTTLARYLPSLISGWVKDAFHPLIRLGYGIEFESTSEIAAGLAYMTITGDDPALANIAARGASKQNGRSYIESVRRCTIRAIRAVRSTFATNESSKARRNCAPQAAIRTPFEEISRACLEVFHATHDFFALHLVTSSHAFRICAP